MKLIKIHFYSIFLFANLWPAITLSQNIDYARGIIEKLCSPDMHGRGYVKAGEEKAADFIQSEMINMGLESLDGSYLQAFNLPVNTFPGKMQLTIDGISLVPGKDFIISPGSPKMKGTFKTRAIEVSDTTIRGDFGGSLIDVPGQVAVIDYAQARRSSDMSVSNINKFIEFYKHDSVLSVPALIVKNYPRMMWSMSTHEDKHPVIYISDKMNISDISQIKIHFDQKFFTDFETQNVLGLIKGTTSPDTLIVFTAHYDHLGRMGEKTHFPGANDNASGIALILDLARYYAENKSNLKYSLLFVAVGAEEAGLLGSLHFVQNPPVDLMKIRFLINLDLAGTGDDGITVVNGSIFEEEFNILKSINEKNNFLPQVNSRGEACNSDHCPFYMAGVPCFFIYTLGGIQAYHDIYDRYQTLPLTAYEGYFKLLTEFTESFF